MTQHHQTAIAAPRKPPHIGGDIYSGPDSTVHEREFPDIPEDDVDVMVDEVFEHVAGNVPDGLEEVDGGLQAGRTCAEEAESDTLDDITMLPSSSLSLDLGRGMQARWARNLEEEMKIFHF
ncbi:uncharacterized protein EI90DRAFT_3133575 [Cantharellus anzutake]|uniref:uncharacterized protein n=1 Tax=Cantharellus anzutake TaxID=1750568 RepID=UPI001908AA67|nr:uncharacterized protein EI90DRAFT_3136269 [Cantharellus anzutake]XP_038909644.1 uncharacterized protein EI90DRAFT_3133575 [Cantharellus anzutake]KAF8314151.1 hypothetical protein EI90DRAFT_3136269 [Cantharellus anzutake]KAF8318075.1 hypothetical protein EI90DRAFT_3133575 [Cantharellus anzutake]